MIVVHPPSSVFSRRHAPSWLLFSFSAGCVNATAFVACARFITHVTGTVSRIGIDASAVTLALDYGLVLFCFIAGALAAATLIDARHHQHKTPLHAVPLFGVSAILTIVGVAGISGLFGVFGGSVEGARDFAFLSILAFAMGLQNAAVATSTGMLVRTTHMTGPATDLGVHLAVAAHTEGRSRRRALAHAALRAGKIASFALGAGVGATLAHRVGYAAFFLPAAGVLIATLSSFVSLPLPTPTPSSRKGTT